LQKPTDGAQRPNHRLRDDRPRASSASRLNGRSIRAARAVRARLAVGFATVRLPNLGQRLASLLAPFGDAERALPVAVAAIVAIASLLALLPNTPQGAVGGTQGSGTTVRIAIGGENAAPNVESGFDAAGNLGLANPTFEPITIPEDVDRQPGVQITAAEAGAFLDDGTLLTGYAPATTVEDGSGLIQTYRVKSGDTLTTIARQYGVSMMTLWWANKLTSKDSLHIGQVLRIPTVDGVVITVTATDTLDSLAAKYHVDPSEIIQLNGLADPTLVVGQVLLIAGARGAPIPTPKPTPTPRVVRSSGGGTSSSLTSKYSGGVFKWPVIGGGNYISQYYHYGHWAIDIAASYGSPVVAAASGKVIFAGWKNNGGGYQVWISHGGNLYTTYNHMSAITVGTGQLVSKGRQVGRIGMTGDATGPHLHFEVWIGPIWNGGSRVNPLRYF
jgi:murein DD-endopeptidase MepM/ murein hydrolase activator NlpD